MQKVSMDIKKINDVVKNIESELKKIKDLLNEAGQLENRENYEEMPGIEGTFDGLHLVAADGSKHEVPHNYAAKTRILFGDRLKLIKDGDKTLYKQIDKQPKQKIQGILTKKEGKWFILAPEGSYKISDTAAEFNNAELNDEAIAIIPRGNTGAPFAALDKVKKPASEAAPNMQPKPVNQTPQQSPKEKEAPKPAPKVEKQDVKKEIKPSVSPAAPAKPQVQKEPETVVVKEEAPKQVPPAVEQAPKEIAAETQEVSSVPPPPPAAPSKSPVKPVAVPQDNKEVSGTIDTSSKDIEEFDLR